MGGVFMADTQTTASEVQFLLPKYVAKKLFITQSIQFQCTKLVKFDTMWWEMDIFFQY